MDFIVELPESKGQNAILVCVDRLTKMAHFCPTTTNITAEGTADLFLNYVFKHHGLPDDVITDRGPQFTSKFTARFLELCNIQGNKSTAFHPQSDGQTERVNQVLEQYLRTFCDYQQDNWMDLLPLAEFTYNNAKHTSTQVSPFMANYGRHPRHTLRITESSKNPAAEHLLEKLHKTQTELSSQLVKAQANYKEFYDRKVKDAPEYKIGNLVWLKRTNIATTRPSQKLDYRKLGPFKIIAVVGTGQLAYRLELPHQMRIHNVFHVSLLEPYKANTIEGRTQPPPPPIEVENGEAEWEVQDILDSKILRRRLTYLVDWVGFGPTERTWEPLAHLEHCRDKIDNYHRRHPRRPGPTL